MDHLVRIDLGCGNYPKDDYIGIDNLYGQRSQNETGRGPELICDLSREPIPFEAGEVDVVHSSHFLEHVDIGRMLDECFRVLRPTGMFVAVLPWAFSAAGMYPGHNAFYTDQWWRVNKQVADLFVLTEFRYRRSAFYQTLPKTVTALFPFPLARNVLMNACDEFVIVAHPRKGYWADTLPLKESDYLA